MPRLMRNSELKALHRQRQKCHVLRCVVILLVFISLLSRIVYATYATWLIFTTFECIPCQNTSANYTSNLFVSKHSSSKVRSSQGMINYKNEDGKSRIGRSLDSSEPFILQQQQEQHNGDYGETNAKAEDMAKEAFQKITYEWSVTINEHEKNLNGNESEEISIDRDGHLDSNTVNGTVQVEDDAVNETSTEIVIKSDDHLNENLHHIVNDTFTTLTPLTVMFNDSAHAQELRINLKSTERDSKLRNFTPDMSTVRNWSALFPYNTKKGNDLRSIMQILKKTTVRRKNDDTPNIIYADDTNSLITLKPDQSINQNQSKVKLQPNEQNMSKVKVQSKQQSMSKVVTETSLLNTSEAYDSVWKMKNESTVSRNTDRNTDGNTDRNTNGNTTSENKVKIERNNGRGGFGLRDNSLESLQSVNSKTAITSVNTNNSSEETKGCSDTCNRFLSIELNDPKNRKWAMILVTGVYYLYALIMLCLFLGVCFYFVDLIIIATFIEGAKLFVGFVLLVIDSFNGKQVHFNLIDININVDPKGNGWGADFTYSEYLLDLLVFVLATLLAIKSLKVFTRKRRKNINSIEDIPSMPSCRGRSLRS